MTRIITSIIMLILFLQSCSQHKKENTIIGKWEGISRVLIFEGDTVDQTWDKTGYYNDYIIEFDRNLKASIYDQRNNNRYVVSYKLNDEILFFDNNKHPIEILNDSTLAYREVRSDVKYFIRQFNRLE